MKTLIRKAAAAATAIAAALTLMIADPSETVNAAAADITHSHKACGGLLHESCTHADIVFEEFPTNSAYLNIRSDKNYYLTRDLTNSDIAFIYDLKNIELNLCLNGHKITAEGNLMLKSCEGCVLNICDCSGDGCIENRLTSSAVQSVNGGQTNIYGGTFSSTNSSTIYTSGVDSVIRVYGGKFNSQSNAVYMQGGNVYIYDGEFTSSGSEPCIQMRHSTDNKKGNLFIYGGKFTSSNKCIDTSGDFSIYGGEFISSMTCIRAGSGNFSISGGNFTCNATAEYQYVIESSGISEINISGGEMRGEQPTTMGIYLANSGSVLNMSGGSVFSYGSAVQGKDGTTPKINISGGFLSSSRASAASRGGKLKMTGGTVSGFMGIGTEGEITGGTIKDCDYCGISVQKNRQVTIGGDVRFENNRFDITLATADDIFTVRDDFQNTATVWVYDDIPKDTRRRITTDGTSESAAEKITSYDNQYDVKYDDGDGYLYLYNHAHEYGDDFESDENEHWQVCTKCSEVGEKTPHIWNEGEITVPPTEESKGVKTFTCTVCGAVKTEELGKTPHEHKFSADWTSDKTGHWHAAACGHDAVADWEEHRPNGEWQKTDEQHWKICAVCHAEIGKNAHTWDGGSVSVPPGGEGGGVKTFTCTVCGAVREENLTNPGHTHVWGDSYEKDSGSHWLICTGCGEAGEKAAHRWNGGEVTVPPTQSTAGERQFACTVCGITRTEAIPPAGRPSGPSIPAKPTVPIGTDTPEENPPASENPENPDSADDPSVPEAPDRTEDKNPSGEPEEPEKTDDSAEPETPEQSGDSGQRGENSADPEQSGTPGGTAVKDVQPGENAPGAVLATPIDELIGAVLTKEERQNLLDGADIRIILTVEDGTDSVPAEDKAAVEAALAGLPGYRLGQYLDVSLLKIMGNVQEKITRTNRLITVTFEIPEALRKSGREYAVIRVHDGKAAVLEDLDNDENTVTIRTDRFSTYALVFSGEEENPPTGTALPALLPAALSAALTILTKRSKEKGKGK